MRCASLVLVLANPWLHQSDQNFGKLELIKLLFGFFIELVLSAELQWLVGTVDQWLRWPEI